MKTAEIIHFRQPDEGNAAARQIRERMPYEPLTHIEIGESERAESKKRAWRLVAFVALTASAFTSLWAISFIVGLVASLHWVTP